MVELCCSNTYPALQSENKTWPLSCLLSYMNKYGFNNQVLLWRIIEVKFIMAYVSFLDKT